MGAVTHRYTVMGSAKEGGGVGAVTDTETNQIGTDSVTLNGSITAFQITLYIKEYLQL